MAAPDWLQHIQWSKPHRLSELMADMSKIPDYQGFYAFNEDPGPLQVGRVLYIGETGQAGGLRSRLRTYLHADPENASIKHSGAIWIHNHRLYETSNDQIYLRWSGWESDKRTRMDIETGLMQYYQAWYNKRQMKKDIDLETI
ncbi:hypothetical protein [Vannielia sp.]|uniref:hypothetical protein n=1 Tax=Vannielia sp. TaxID=2813045 RepID=UPI00263A1A27|nr:hypothetical protein [Vannielia sp.]MDF1871644.1 hypothetical protein [Vannielia sp.]